MRPLYAVFVLFLLVTCSTAAPFPELYGVSGSGLDLPRPPKSLGYDLTEADFLPFQSFRYQGLPDLTGDAVGLRTVAAPGMVLWTHRYQVARARHQEAGAGPERGPRRDFDRARS